MGFIFKNYGFSGDGKGYIREARKWVLDQYAQKEIDLDNPKKQLVNKQFGHSWDEDEVVVPTLKHYRGTNNTSVNQIITNMTISELCNFVSVVEEELNQLGYVNVTLGKDGSYLCFKCQRTESDEEVNERYNNYYDWDVKTKAAKLKQLAEKKGITAKQRREDEAQFERLKAKLGK